MHLWTPRPRKGSNAFYCRAQNRLVDGCPEQNGPTACPLRHECRAFKNLSSQKPSAKSAQAS